MSFEHLNNQTELKTSEQFIEKEQSLLEKFRERLGGKVGKGLLSTLRLCTFAWTLSHEPTHAPTARQDNEMHFVDKEQRTIRENAVMESPTQVPRESDFSESKMTLPEEDTQEQPAESPLRNEDIPDPEPQSEALKRLFNTPENLGEPLTPEEEDSAHEELKNLWQRDFKSMAFVLKHFEHFRLLKGGKVGDAFLEYLLHPEVDGDGFYFPRAWIAHAGHEFFKNHPRADTISKFGESIVKANMAFPWFNEAKRKEEQSKKDHEMLMEMSRRNKEIWEEFERVNKEISERYRQLQEEDKIPFTW